MRFWGKAVIELSADGWWRSGWIIATLWISLSSQPGCAGRGVTNAFTDRPVGSAFFQEQNYNWIDVPPGFVTDRVCTCIRSSPWEWSNKDGLGFAKSRHLSSTFISAVSSSLLSSSQSARWISAVFISFFQSILSHLPPSVFALFSGRVK